MARKILKPERFEDFYDEAMSLEGKRFMKGLKPRISPWLLFRGDYQFEAMAFNSQSKPFPNGSFKLGTIRYNPKHIYLPLSDRLLAFESSEFDRGEEPRGHLGIKYAVICPLEELTDEEILWDGFDSRKDMLHQMTEMESRYYKDLTPKSMVSYFALGALTPFSGMSVDGVVIARILKERGYWAKLKQRDSSRWTEDIEAGIKARFKKPL